MRNKSETHRLESTIPEEQFSDYQAALNTYGFRTHAYFGRLCVQELIRAHKDGEGLSCPLRLRRSGRMI